VKLRIGTRGSRLALWQAEHVAAALRAEVEVEVVVLETRGDRIQGVPLSRVEGQAFFTAEIERALLEDRIDLAVHSHKDLATESPPGLAIAAVPERGPAVERLLVLPEANDPDALFLPLKRGARVGTSAPRRRAQLLALRPDLEVVDLRGNVPTRVDKLHARAFDATVLAAAGLERLELDLSGLVDVPLSCELFVPAPAQGALAIQVREGDERTFDHCRRLLHHPPTAVAVSAERSLLRAAGGGCSLPLGALVEGPGPFRVRAFLGADCPHEGALARWASASGSTPAEAAERALLRLETGEPTGEGPLGGLRIALAGSAAEGSLLGDRLTALGARVHHEKVLDIEDLEVADLPARLAALKPGDVLCLTSAQAARRLRGCSAGKGVRVIAVGPATARALREAGFDVDRVGEGGVSELLAGLEGPVGRVLLPCAERTALEMAGGSPREDLEIELLRLYRTSPRLGAEGREDVDARVYMSTSAVAALREWELARAGAAIPRVPMGRRTHEALSAAGLAALPIEGAGPGAAVRCIQRHVSPATS